MKIIKDNVEYQGAAEELAIFFDLSNRDDASDVKVAPDFSEDDFVPLEEIVEESKTLREKLAENNAYNPYGGVIPSKEPKVEEVSTGGGIVTADSDTGVQLSD